MNLAQLRLIACVTLTLLLGSNATCRAETPTRRSSYSHMASLGRYLSTERSVEIALARSAAPASIYRYAAVLVLGRHGYETIRAGKNGFTCLVERAWMSPFDSPEFWNPKIRGPICYNLPASRSILLYTINRTELVMAGLSKIQMIDRIDAKVKEKKLPPPEPGSMSYMMSKKQYLGDAVGPWLPHLMFAVSAADGAEDGVSWGANRRGSPVMLNTSYRRVPEPETIFMVPVGNWSDGTAAPQM
jgi:hypothetical protein